MNSESKVLPRAFATSAAVLLLGMAFAETASANPPREENLPSPSLMGLPGAARQGADPLQLLQVNKVQQELKLTEAQVAKLGEISSKVHAAATSELGVPGDRTEAQIRESIEKSVTEARDQVAEVLDEGQLNRFKEIVLQVLGWGALADREIAETLQLSKDQQEKVGKLAQESAEKMRGGFEVPRSGDPAERKKVMEANAGKMDAIFGDADSTAESVLTAEQRVTLETLRGKPFELDLADVRGGQ